MKDRLIDDPCIDVPPPNKPGLRKTFDDVLSAREVDQLVEAIHDRTPGYESLKTNDRYEALVFMGAWLGPRWNEAIGLRRCDLNPLRHEVTFGKVVVNQNGSQTYVERLSKTEDFRTIPVPAPVMDRLLEHIARSCPDAGREDFLFQTRAGTHPLRAGVVRTLGIGHGSFRPAAVGCEDGGAGCEVVAEPVLVGVAQRREHAALDGPHGDAGDLQVLPAGSCELRGQSLPVRGGGRSADQPAVLQAAKHAVHRLAGDEGRASQLGVGRARSLREHLEARVLRNGEVQRAQYGVHG